jgi:hypothetical protein
MVVVISNAYTAVCYKCERWPEHLKTRVDAWPDRFRSTPGYRANSRPYHEHEGLGKRHVRGLRLSGQIADELMEVQGLDGRNGRFNRRRSSAFDVSSEPAQRFLQL